MLPNDQMQSGVALPVGRIASKANGRYFRNNRRCGIKTFQDDRIESLLGSGVGVDDLRGT